MTKSSRRVLLLYVLPVFFLLGVIFILSAQTHGQQDIRSWIKREISDSTIQKHFSGVSFQYGSQQVSLSRGNASGFVEFFIRKFAHVFIYCALGVLITRLVKAFTRWKMVMIVLISVLACAAYAATDEIHQSFIIDRTSSLADVVLDTCGALLGSLIYLFLKYYKGKGEN